MSDTPRIEELRRRVQADPASIAFAALAEEYRRVGHFDEAIQTCVAGLKRHPSYLSAHVTLGRALIEVGRFDEAEQELQWVLAAAPENLAAIRGLADIHHRRRDNTYDAEARALSELPVHAEAFHGEGAAPPETAPLLTDQPPPATATPPGFEAPPPYEPPAYPPAASELPPFTAAPPETPRDDAPTCEPPAYEPPVFEPPVFEPPRYDPPGTFELSNLGITSHPFPSGAKSHDPSAEVEALERFLGSVIAARASIRAR